MRQVVVAIAFCCLISGILSQCSFTDTANGCLYDFTSLPILNGPPYYEFNDTDAATNALGFWEINVCAPVSGTVCEASSGVCQTDSTASYNCGNANANFTALPWATPGTCQGAVLTYSNGTACPLAGNQRSTLIYLECLASAATAFISGIRETGPCVYQVEIQTDKACGSVINSTTASPSPSISISMSMSMNVGPAANNTVPVSSSTSGGGHRIWWALAILVVVIAVVVVVGGVVVYKKRQQRSYASIDYN